VPYAFGTTCKTSSVLISSELFFYFCETNNLFSYIGRIEILLNYLET